VVGVTVAVDVVSPALVVVVAPAIVELVVVVAPPTVELVVVVGHSGRRGVVGQLSGRVVDVVVLEVVELEDEEELDGVVVEVDVDELEVLVGHGRVVDVELLDVELVDDVEVVDDVELVDDVEVVVGGVGSCP